MSDLKVGSGLTIKGSLTMLVNIENEGTIKVDYSADTMYIGYDPNDTPPNPAELDGVDGTYAVSSGSMIFRYANLFSSNPGQGEEPLEFDIDGGTLQLVYDTVSTQGTIDWDADISGGTLDVDRWFKTSGDLTQSGGTVDIGAAFDITGDLALSAGTLTMAYANTITGDMDISGGTLDIDENFTCNGTLDFSGGTIRLEQGKNATFDPN